MQNIEANICAQAFRGPLILLDNIPFPKQGENVNIQLDNGQILLGQIIEVQGKQAVVLQNNQDLSKGNLKYEFTGSSLKLPVSEEMLGRTFNGLGYPIDKGSTIMTDNLLEIQGQPINPSQRALPDKLIETGISAIDMICPIAQGSRMPLFTGTGLSHHEIMLQICRQARLAKGKDIFDYSNENFVIVFAGFGLTMSTARYLQSEFSKTAIQNRAALFLNQSADSSLERLITSRLVLTLAEHLAFERDFHVLTIMDNLNAYIDLLHEILIAKNDVSGRKGYPNSLYTDLAAIYERAGRIQGKNGSITLMPILTMYNDDIAHPIPDFNAQVADGQIVLNRQLSNSQVKILNHYCNYFI